MSKFLNIITNNEYKKITKNLKYLIIKFLVIFLVALIGTIVTYKGLKDERYKNFILSNLQPPGWVFSIVWAIIYIGYFYTWMLLPNDIITFILFTMNMMINLLWTISFFGMFNLIFSRILIICLLILTVGQIIYISLYLRISFIPSYISLFIYAIWLCIASYFNFSIKKKF